MKEDFINQLSSIN